MRTPALVLIVLGLMALGGAACAPDSGPPTAPTPGGTHSVSWNVGDACPALPPEARQRTYDATLEDGVVTLVTGTFLEGLICTFGTGLGCNQFRLDQNGNDVQVSLVNPGEYHGGQIVERVAPFGWLEVTGTGSGRSDGSTIRATLNGHIWYCPGNPATPFPCAVVGACTVPNMELTITRRSRWPGR